MITLEREQFVNKKGFMRNLWGIQIKLNQTFIICQIDPKKSIKTRVELPVC